jgi:putative ABC transport system permease protein
MVLGNSFALLRNLANDLDVVRRILIAAAGFGTGSLICLAGALAPIQRLKKLEPLVAIKEE